MAWQSDRIAAGLPGPDWVLPTAFRAVQARSRRVLQRSHHDTVRIGLARQPARWFREYMTYDPRVDLPAVVCPVLAITGEEDLQVDPGDLDVIARLVAGPCSTHALPELTHLLCSTTEPHSILQYRDLVGRPLDPRLTSLITTWIQTVV